MRSPRDRAETVAVLGLSHLMQSRASTHPPPPNAQAPPPIQRGSLASPAASARRRAAACLATAASTLAPSSTRQAALHVNTAARPSSSVSSRIDAVEGAARSVKGRCNRDTPAAGRPSRGTAAGQGAERWARGGERDAPDETCPVVRPTRPREAPRPLLPPSRRARTGRARGAGLPPAPPTLPRRPNP